MVGKAKNDDSLHKIPPHLRKELFIGNETQHMMVRNQINRSYTVQRGHVTNWDQMESIWTYIFRNLSVNAVEQPVILSEAPLNCRSNRERMAQILFESFYVPAMYIESPQCWRSMHLAAPVAAFLDVGKTSPIACQSARGMQYVMQ